MKKQIYDYRGLRFSTLTGPQYRHLLLLLGWIGYFIAYFLTENLIPVESCYTVHCFLDDLVPFCEWFIIPYVGWYVLIVFSLLYFLMYNIDSFKKLQTYIIITQVVAVIAYIVFPTCQELRPAEFAHDNFLTDVVKLLYSVDTNTGVCPSLHVAYSLGIASTWVKEKGASRKLKAFIVFVVILICMSVSFVKQHSVVDIFAAIPVGILAEVLVFGKSYWRNKIKTKEN